MKLIRAQHLGMCFGVRDAIALAHQHSRSGSLTVLGELVHNQSVLDDLGRRGVRIEHAVESITTPNVMITAHGVSERVHRELRDRGLNVIEATCPLVHVAHRAVRELVRQGYHPVIIGRRGHVEVRGLTGDLDQFDVILSEDDINALATRPRYGVAAQTTQPIARVRELVACLRARFPSAEVKFVDTVCQPTKLRQLAAEELAQQCDVVVVIGGTNSNNTRELVRTCERHCGRVHHVQSAANLQPDWFQEDDTVGITAGTSTPDWVIESVAQKIERLAGRNVPEHEAAFTVNS